ncbi:MAG: TIGR02281 family clan AA aspartic protease [Hyphomicrobium sp.]|jgi:aspartyl protease family protein|uniref:retropepsin-like aspartic protease family protein n=1 Tax=Hyphomicrobium sp. TaxID=82 RepID=UPI0025B7C17C|nr:TIGR02281 family clan AA aspartic protease [Hyphomicrobium sp.]MBX9861179.1 TIGR02281 family clan AA aspartic protease [Hyphomicrobium sp.]
MALSSGTRSLFGELASWGAAAAILIVGIVHYDSFRSGLNQFLGIADLPSAAGPETAKASAETTPVSHSGREELRAQQDGHYYARAEVNGRLLDVMVDTGASMVALTYEDAERAGLSLRPSDFTGRVSTANGTAAVAPVTLDRVSIGHVQVRNVRAAVCERGKLEKTLLGMSFLSKLERVDINQGRLTLIE